MNSVTDFVSGRKMDIQSLLTLLKNVEDRPEERFYMAVWHTPKLPSRQHCGSACCAIGTFCEANPTDKLKLAPRIDFKSTSLKPEINLHPQQVIDDKETAIGHAAIQFRFSISIRESLFLFGGGHLHNTLSAHSARSARSTHAINLSKPEFLNRLRKFIYYKLRKSELLSDYNASRRAGDIGVADEVLRKVEEVEEVKEVKEVKEVTCG